MATSTAKRSKGLNISGIKIPDSGELRAIAVMARESEITIEGSVPMELLPLALEIIALTRKLQMKCDSYDSRSQNVKVRTLKANGEATREILERERSERVAKESEKNEKREKIEKYKKLSPMEKRFFRQTGITPEEQLEKMMEAAKIFMQGLKSEAE
jgi:phage-related minor tail protein